MLVIAGGVNRVPMQPQIAKYLVLYIKFHNLSSFGEIELKSFMLAKAIFTKDIT